MTVQPKISFQGVTRRFGDGDKAFLALDRFSLDVALAEVLDRVLAAGIPRDVRQVDHAVDIAFH